MTSVTGRPYFENSLNPRGTPCFSAAVLTMMLSAPPRMVALLAKLAERARATHTRLSQPSIMFPTSITVGTLLTALESTPANTCTSADEGEPPSIPKTSATLSTRPETSAPASTTNSATKNTAMVQSTCPRTNFAPSTGFPTMDMKRPTHPATTAMSPISIPRLLDRTNMARVTARTARSTRMRTGSTSLVVNLDMSRSPFSCRSLRNMRLSMDIATTRHIVATGTARTEYPTNDMSAMEAARALWGAPMTVAAQPMLAATMIPTMYGRGFLCILAQHLSTIGARMRTTASLSIRAVMTAVMTITAVRKPSLPSYLCIR